MTDEMNEENTESTDLVQSAFSAVGSVNNYTS